MAGYLGAIPVPQATQHRESFTATSGQTTFNTAGYTVGFLDVYLNGSHLSPADFTATNGSDVVLASGASTGDVCDIISYTAFEVANQTFTGTTTLTGDLALGDNNKAIFGAGSDLQIYHDGSNSYIKDVGTGDLTIAGTNLQIRSSATNENFIYCVENGAVNLYHNDAQKLATTSTGVNVTGKATLTSGELTFSGSISDPNGAAYIWRPADNTLAFGTANEERMRITSAGSVGIGTSSPNRSLTIEDGDVQIHETGTSNDPLLNFSVGGTQASPTQSWSMRIDNSDGDKFQLMDVTDSRIVLTADGSGNVGIGTSSPDSYDAEADNLVVASSGHTGITIASTGANQRTNIYFSDGTSGSAAYQGGFSYNHNDDSLLVRTAATERMRLDASGNVNVGVPTADSSSNYISVTGGLAGSQLNAQMRFFGKSISNTGATYETGRISGGSTSASYSLSGGLVFSTSSNNGSNVLTLAERMRINSSGNILIGTTAEPSSSQTGVRISGTDGQNFWKSSNSGTSGYDQLAFFNGNGLVGTISTSGSATAYNTSSDYRLKTDAQPMTGASDRVLALNPINFKWIADGTRVDGFLAHEAQAVVPEAVTGTKDGMKDEKYQVSAATGDIYTPATDAYVDEDGNDVDAVDEVIHSADAEQPETLEDGQQWRETTAAVMGTRSVPDMQGIDQSKLVPLLVASLQEALARITALENA